MSVNTSLAKIIKQKEAEFNQTFFVEQNSVSYKIQSIVTNGRLILKVSAKSIGLVDEEVSLLGTKLIFEHSVQVGIGNTKVPLIGIDLGDTTVLELLNQLIKGYKTLELNVNISKYLSRN